MEHVSFAAQEVEQIELVWVMTNEWENHWNVWKSGRFIDVETGDMEEISTTLFRKLQKMSRELKVNSLRTMSSLSSSSSLLLPL